MLKIAWSPTYAHPLPQVHRFPMDKYNLLPEQLLYEGTVNHENFFSPGTLSEGLILSVHEKAYWQKLKSLKLSKSEIRRTGFPLDAQLVERETRIAQGTVDCAKYALDHGVAMNIAGGTHHAFADRGEGFCLLNDIAIASLFLLDQKLACKIMIVDLDVHQGNGTAQIFRNEARVFTFSMHGKHNYPLKKEKSDLDVELPDGTGDRQYLELLDKHLKRSMEKIRPDFIFFQSGVDVLATDKLGRLGLSIQGCKERDRTVLRACRQHGLPVVASMGGGYSERMSHIIEAHANTYRLAQEIFF